MGSTQFSLLCCKIVVNSSARTAVQGSCFICLIQSEREFNFIWIIKIIHVITVNQVNIYLVFVKIYSCTSHSFYIKWVIISPEVLLRCVVQYVSRVNLCNSSDTWRWHYFDKDPIICISVILVRKS